MWISQKTVGKMLCVWLRFKILFSSVEYGVMILVCFAASRPGQSVIIDGALNSELYHRNLQENVKVSIHDLEHNRKWVMKKRQQTHKLLLQRMVRAEES